MTTTTKIYVGVSSSDFLAKEFYEAALAFRNAYAVDAIHVNNEYCRLREVAAKICNEKIFEIMKGKLAILEKEGEN